jgi:hypothetical protein
LRRCQSIDHAMSGWDACPRLRRIECQIAISGSLTTRHRLPRQFAPGAYRHDSVAILSYTTAHAGGRVARGFIKLEDTMVVTETGHEI